MLGEEVQYSTQSREDLQQYPYQEGNFNIIIQARIKRKDMLQLSHFQKEDMFTSVIACSSLDNITQISLTSKCNEAF